MNNWVDLLADPSAIRAIYHNSLPSLDGIDLHEVVLHRDGPRILLRFDLRQFPERPPKKWEAARFNRVQMKLIAVGVHELAIIGLQSKCILNLRISKDGGVIRLSADNGEVKIDIAAEHLVFDTISAYRTE